MDVLEKLQKKNEAHQASIEAENREIWTGGIHTCFAVFILYYEYFNNYGDAVIPSLVTFLLLYIVYDIIISICCGILFNNFALKSFALIVVHSVFTYYWIFHKNIYGGAFLLGLIFFISLIFSWLKKSPNKNMWSFGIHCSFILCLVYYEVFSTSGANITFEYLSTLFFIYIIYNVIILFFCKVIFTNLILECLALITFHSTFIYYWIWHQDQHGVAFILGLMLIFSIMVFGFKVKYYSE